MKCMNCDNEAVGRSKYCGDSCKVLYNRKQSVTVNNRKQQTVNRLFDDDGVMILPGHPEYQGCCYQDENGDWQVRTKPDTTCPVKATNAQTQAIWDSQHRMGQPTAYSAPHQEATT